LAYYQLIQRFPAIGVMDLNISKLLKLKLRLIRMLKERETFWTKVCQIVIKTKEFIERKVEELIQPPKPHEIDNFDKKNSTQTPPVSHNISATPVDLTDDKTPDSPGETLSVDSPSDELPPNSGDKDGDTLMKDTENEEKVRSENANEKKHEIDDPKYQLETLLEGKKKLEQIAEKMDGIMR